MNRKQEFLDKLMQLQKEYQMFVTSEIGPIGVYAWDKITEKVITFDTNGRITGTKED